jgi:hypothetical protein
MTTEIETTKTPNEAAAQPSQCCDLLNAEMFGDRRNYIDYSEPECPMLNLEIGGMIYRFSVAAVSPAARDWLAKTVHRQMVEIHRNAVTKTRLGMQAQFKDLLGI